MCVSAIGAARGRFWDPGTTSRVAIHVTSLTGSVAGFPVTTTSMWRDSVKLRGLRQARQRSGLSISQLADLTGLRRDTITHLEHGQEDPQPYVLRRLGAALSASSAELLGVSVIESTERQPRQAPGRDGKPVVAAS